MVQLKLFAVYLGGRAKGCNIELHDVVFVVGKSLEETYPLLQKKWFGQSHKIHIDAYMELSLVDHFKIEIVPKDRTKESPYKLFFMNFGAYDGSSFGEVHQIAFYVATDKASAISRARKELCKGMKQVHCDDSLNVSDLFELDDILEISEVDGYSLRFIPLETCHIPQPKAGYIKFLDALKSLPVRT